MDEILEICAKYKNETINSVTSKNQLEQTKKLDNPHITKKQGENLTITNSRFAGNRSPQFNGKSERTVNFQVTDGGGNIVQNKNGADKSIAGAKFVEDLELDVNPVPQSEVNLKNLEPLRYEAEDLTLDGYQVETVKNSSASDNRHISLKGSAENKGSATGKFKGEPGIYQVKIGYFDENDGQSKVKLIIGKESTSFVFDRDLPSNWVKPASKTSRIAIEEVELESGDSFKIEGVGNQGEFARIDYVEFSPIKADSQSPIPASPSNVEKVEEEENNLPKAVLSEDRFINGIVNLSNVDFDGDAQVDERVSVILDDIDSTASYSNSAGFYQVLDLDGTVLDAITNQQIRPGEQGYEAAAFNQLIAELEFDENDYNLTAEVDGGIFLAPYLIANGTVEEFIDKNPNNNKSGNGLNAYFAFGNANPDGIEHLKASNNNFGFEDLYGGGDKDFSDLTFNVSVESA